MDDLAGAHRARLQLLDDVGVAPLRHEADILAVALVGHGEAELAGHRPGLVLGEVAERKAQEIQLLARRGEQEIALVAIEIDRAEQRPSAADHARAHIVAGRHRRRAKLMRRAEQIGELDGLIAGDARNRSLAMRIALGERLDHRLAEARLIVQHVMRNAELRRDLPRVVDVLPRTAGP
jgi:hypothetical protein